MKKYKLNFIHHKNLKNETIKNKKKLEMRNNDLTKLELFNYN